MEVAEDRAGDGQRVTGDVRLSGENVTAEFDALYLGMIAGCVSVLTFLYFFRHNEVLLYGDATAHIHIARRVFDSRTPGLAQLGTVWLPLPHVLMLPFVFSHWAWQTGLGGSLPSMIAYVAGVLGVFRLVRGALPENGAARVAAWFAALLYAGNPNLIYLQTTAMTEPLYLALFVWATVYFSEFVRATRTTGPVAKARRERTLRRCGWLLFAAMLTRYDGWFAAATFVIAALLLLWHWTGRRTSLWRSPLRPLVMRLMVVTAAAAALWFTYNALFWKNPLEFATGPYSARAIQARTETAWHHPGWREPKTAALYFLKSAKLNMVAGQPQHENEKGPGPWLRFEHAWLVLAVVGTVLLLVRLRQAWPLLLLWAPLPFYTLSIAWGDVPIFIPVWWPHSYYNVRYGLQLLPVFAVFTALVLYFVGSVRWKRRQVLIAAAVLAGAFSAASYLITWRNTPICLREARVNSAGRILFDRSLAVELEKLPPKATLLMYTASHAAALEFAGLPLRRTINETNYKLWERALAAPAHSADFVLAFETPDDPVWRAVESRRDDLQLLAIIDSPAQPRALLYRRR